MAALDKLIKNNEFPIVFIGSGLSIRYLKNFPNWRGLLEYLWNLTGEQSDFYAFLNRTRNDIEKEKPNLKQSELDYLTNIRVGTMLEQKINKLFYDEKIKIDNFTQKEAFEKNITPFKKVLSNRFLNYEFKDEMLDEFEYFKKMLIKTQIILTTNYDTLIEDAYNSISDYGIKTYIGQKGFFEQTMGYAELYKLHGCVTDPKSLIICENDYRRFEKNSVLISAKIISQLLHSPIVFLGYSLTDQNIRNIIRDFSSSLSEKELLKLESKIIVIEREEGLNEIREETVNDRDLNCRFTYIRTDNFGEIYKKMAEINQGVAPSEVRKYQHIIKNLIIERGKEGTLKSLLVAPSQLDELEKNIGNKKLVVALGDSTYIFAIPDVITYVYDYIFEKDELNTDIVLRFLANQPSKSRLPFLRHVNIETISNSNLHPGEKEKLRQRLENHGDFLKEKQRITNRWYQIKFDDLESILKEDYPLERQYGIIAYNIDNLNLNDVELYVKKAVEKLKENGEIRISTELRRLILLYDLKKNKRDNA
ncbi:SIR2-like domain protein [Anoxybacillus sp. B7M1]|uniref:SIR2 family protein n=1 Tax=unclassified Anoxybacillus TaxID=2639704 RepID=UPI0005CD90E5|nr:MULTISPECIES: SIR2 family protein [unclassified Anoxybacillus]ANB56474.1 SIR2-like domain protein [Anoxybacillus sp. B2M1]ANB65211.1 SIR2-like domain protein [Anoxybacillus sp. B7M1]